MRSPIFVFPCKFVGQRRGKTMQGILSLWSSDSLLKVLPRLFLFIVLLAASCGQVPQPSPRLPSQNVPSSASTEINNKLASMALQTSASPTEYHLGPEDLLQITLFNVPET